MKSIYHRLTIIAPRDKVYEALTTQSGLAGWWTPDTIANAGEGSILRFGFGPDYFKEMKVVELQPQSTVKWMCKTGFDDWLGTSLSFTLKENQRGTALSFRHDGGKECTPELATCTYDWAMFLRSLKLLCETGIGLPYPDQHK